MTTVREGRTREVYVGILDARIHSFIFVSAAYGSPKQGSSSLILPSGQEQFFCLNQGPRNPSWHYIFLINSHISLSLKIPIQQRQITIGYAQIEILLKCAHITK